MPRIYQIAKDIINVHIIFYFEKVLIENCFKF